MKKTDKINVSALCTLAFVVYITLVSLSIVAFVDIVVNDNVYAMITACILEVVIVFGGTSLLHRLEHYLETIREEEENE